MAKLVKENGIVLFLTFVFLISYMSCAIYFVDDDSSIQQVANGEDVIGLIQPDVIYSQKIIPKNNNLKAVAFQFGTYNITNKGVIKAKLYDEGKSIFEWNINMDSLEDNQYYMFFLDKTIKNSTGREYIIQFKFELEEGDMITIYCGDSGENSGYCIQDEEISGVALACKVLYQNRIWGKNMMFGIFMICLILYFVIVIKKEMCSEKVFLITFIPICILYLLCNAPFNVPDEPAHFYRAFEISEGYMISDESAGREFPFKDIEFSQYRHNWEQVIKDRTIKLSEEKEFRNFWNTAVYAPISYMPHAIGIFMARIFTNNFWIIFYMGRLFNIICITVLFYYAIKISPLGKEMIYLIAMIPMNVHQVVSYSPDGMLLAIICFIVSLVMYLKYIYEKKLTFWQYILIYFLVAAVSLYKVIYLPICLTFLLIPSDRFESKKKFFIHGTIAAIIGLCMSIGWLSIANRFVISSNSSDMGAQLKYIIYHPFEYYLIVIKTIFDNAESWIMTMLGSSLGWLDLPVSGGLMLCYFGLLIYVITYRKKKNIKTCFAQIICIAEVILQFCLLLTTEYLSWTPVRNQGIWGVQGRYLMPMLIYIYYMRSANYDSSIEIENKERFNMILLVVIINVCTCFSCLIQCTS